MRSSSVRAMISARRSNTDCAQRTSALLVLRNANATIEAAARIGMPTSTRVRRLTRSSSITQVAASGMMIITPSESPSHQVPQLRKACGGAIEPATSRLATPTVALIRQATGPPTSIVARMRPSSPKLVGKPTQRRTRNAPARACNAAPMPMHSGSAIDCSAAARPEESNDSGVFTSNEPSTTPGHNREPKISSAASAIPAEGQNAVAYPGGIAIIKASRASSA